MNTVGAAVGRSGRTRANRWRSAARIPPRARVAITVVVALAGSTAVISLLEGVLRIPYAAPVYLLAVLVAGALFGTLPAVLTSVAAFLLYDFFFIPPILTLTVADPNEWLNLLLFLAVSVVIGRLAALQAARAREAVERAREAQALFGISGALALSQSLGEAAPIVLDRIAESTAMDRAWLGLGATPGEERIVADSEGGAPLPVPAQLVVLQRTPGNEPARWTRVHVGTGSARQRVHVGTGPARQRGASTGIVHRIRMEVPGEVLGSLWVLRAREQRDPDRAETRILSAAADQLAQAVRRDRLVMEATEAEVARRSEALKTALLDSVSHDLRTPLASIRAAAGSLLDPEVTWTRDEQRDALRSIDAEAERMNRLVRNLLDLSRIEGGALRPDLAPCELVEVVRPVVQRVGRSTDKEILVAVPETLPLVVVDEGYLDQVLTNLLENAVRYGGRLIRIGAQPVDDGRAVELVVEDDGPGVPDAALPRLFEKFYRVPQQGEGARHGMGVGLTVAQGLVQALGGAIEARRSTLGGLALSLRLPTSAPLPEPEDAPPAGVGR